MARDVESLVLRMSADLRAMEKQMAKAAGVADRRLNEIEQRARKADKNLGRIMDGAGKNMVASLKSSLSGIAPVLAGAFSAGAVLRYADSYTALQNRLKATGLAGEALRRVEDSLYESANRNGVSVAATAELYQRAAMARENLGASEEELLKIVSGTASALKLQGTSATAASGALLQLGQLLGGVTVQSAEYNSLIDGLPTVLEAVAKGSDRWGGSVNKLSLDVKAGKVSVQEFAAAMLKGFADIEARAGNATTTVGAALETLNNELGKLVGRTDSGLSATARMAQGIEGLANNLDTVVLVVGALSTLLFGRFVLAMTASGGAMIANGVAAARLAGFQAAMTASMTGTTTATVVATGAMARFNAMLLANPIGAVIIAVAALSAGIYLLNKRFSEGERVSRQLDAQSRRTSEAFAEYEDAARKAAEATGEAKKEADELAKSKRALYVIELQQAQALAQTTAEMARQRAEMARLAAQEATNRAPKTEAEAIGQLAYAGGAQSEAARAQAQADQAKRDADKAQADLVALEARIRAGFATPAPAGPPASADSSGSRSRGNAAQLARARAELDIEREIARARAIGDETAIRAAEERQELAQLVRQYESAGVQDARAAAIEHLGWLNEARVAVEQREAAEAEVDRILAGRERQLEREADFAQLMTDQTLDRLGYEAELARLSGNEGAIQSAERRLWIENRTLEIMRLRLALTEDEARAMAGAEWAELDRTEAGRDMARGLVDLLRSDSIWEEAGQRFREAAWDGIEQLIAQIFNSMNGGKEGGGWLSAIGSLFTGGLSGKRAMGGPVTAGGAYLVGERRPEVFVPNVGGTIIPSVSAAMAKMNSGGGARVTQVFQVNAQGAILSDQLMSEMQSYAANAAASAGAQAFTAARKVIPGEMAKAQRYSARLGTVPR